MFRISEISVGEGTVGICPVPGRYSTYSNDLTLILSWRPSFIITLTDSSELKKAKVSQFPQDIQKANIKWLHFPITDLGIPNDCYQGWKEISEQIHASLAVGGRILCHCYGGCGRSGMVTMRLMCELGEPGDAALARLRRIRDCAVETDAQRGWAEGVLPLNF
tara:strand:- start:5 stop:493 length:489 start_codon:yes stop_codon:yes gene_type:complete